VFEALTRIHARSCRTAFEVHRLLSGGFPMGALARCRTLHELAVTAAVLNDYGRRPEYLDLAQRYLAHDAVLDWSDALIFNKYADQIGATSFSAEEMAIMKTRRDDAVTHFGDDFAKPYGWAQPILGNQRPTFERLEQAANLSHLRGHYRWASHEVHADAKGARMNIYDRGNISYKASGQVNDGLAEPGHLALISLHQATVSVVLSTGEPTPRDLIALMTLQRLLDDAGEAFSAGESSVHDAEQRFQRRVSGRSERRHWPWRHAGSEPQ
jgi:hypothetical protein